MLKSIVAESYHDSPVEKKNGIILHRGRFMKLHSKLHLTFMYAFMPRFYSIACLSKLRSIIASLGLVLGYHKFLDKVNIYSSFIKLIHQVG